jgi:hypothetical protein
MNVNAALKASAQLAESSQLGMGAFDHPAMTLEPVIAFDAFAGNAVLVPRLLRCMRQRGKS